MSYQRFRSLVPRCFVSICLSRLLIFFFPNSPRLLAAAVETRLPMLVCCRPEYLPHSQFHFWIHLPYILPTEIYLLFVLVPAQLFASVMPTAVHSVAERLNAHESQIRVEYRQNPLEAGPARDC
jgi:hypothetical protein